MGQYTFIVHYTYILRLANNKYYIGYSKDLKKRLVEHKLGRVKATKNFLPFKLIHYSAFETSTLASNFEKYLKTSSGFAFRNKRLIQR